MQGVAIANLRISSLVGILPGLYAYRFDLHLVI